MDIKGVCYDTGRAYGGGFVTRRVFDPAMTRRELQIIRDDLHCNAVRFQGTDIGRLMTAATDALKLGGLQVWLSPELFKKSREATLAYLVQAAAAAEPLRRAVPRPAGLLRGHRVEPVHQGTRPGPDGQPADSEHPPRGPALRRRTPSSSRPSSPRRTTRSGRRSTGRSPTPRPRSRSSTGACSTSSASTSTGTPRTTIATPRRSGATSGRASPWSTPSSGTVPTGGTGPVRWSSARWTRCRWLLHRIPLAGRLVRPRLKRGTHVRDEEHQARELTKTLGHPGRRGRGRRLHLDLRRPLADPQRRPAPRPGHDLHRPGQDLRARPRDHLPRPALGAQAGLRRGGQLLRHPLRNRCRLTPGRCPAGGL